MSTFLAVFRSIRVALRYAAYAQFESAFQKGRITGAELERLMLMMGRVEKPFALVCMLFAPILMAIGSLMARVTRVEM